MSHVYILSYRAVAKSYPQPSLKTSINIQHKEYTCLCTSNLSKYYPICETFYTDIFSVSPKTSWKIFHFTPLDWCFFLTLSVLVCFILFTWLNSHYSTSYFHNSVFLSLFPSQTVHYRMKADQKPKITIYFIHDFLI